MKDQIDQVEASEDPRSDVERERDGFRDRLLRTTAEFDNYRKRIERERRDLGDFVSADVIRDVLPALDDLERALAAPVTPGSAEAFHRGVELIHRQLLDTLKKRGVEPIEALGRDFDTAWHEAVGDEPANGRRDGEVITEVRRGYKIG